MRIGFIGIGKLGKEVAEVMYDVGHEVEGYDIQFKTDYIKFPMKYDLREVCENKEIIFVALPTPHHPDYGGTKPSSHLNPSDFDYHPLKNLLHELNQFVRQNQLVVLISTVLPGITRTRLATLAHTYRFIYNPYLIAMGTVKEDMVKPEMVIIGTEDGDETGDAKILVDFYKTIVPKEKIIGTWFSPTIDLNDIIGNCNSLECDVRNSELVFKIINEYKFCVQREGNYNYICEFMIGLDGDKFIMIERVELVE